MITLAETKMPKKNKLILSIAICVVVLLVVFSGSVIAQLSYNKVYDGVYLDSTDNSGMTKEELISQIPEIFDKSLSKTITLTSGDTAITTFESLSVSPVLDTEAIRHQSGISEHTPEILGDDLGQYLVQRLILPHLVFSHPFCFLFPAQEGWWLR